jgi:RNA polymerase sigma-70 factor (TIGR02960 family)
MSEDRTRFSAETECFRRELLAYCYRVLGSASEAEDLVQETYLRAWRAYAGFQRRASMRSWLYKIASNVCLTALESRRSRVLPSALSAAYDGDRPPTEGVEDVSWLEPLPDSWIITDDPAALVIARESLRLALIASLQHFPARQRAIFILREILAFSAEETAEVLDCTVAAVKSGLQRVRARLEELVQTRDELLEPTDPRARELLDGYVAAFERSDASLLLKVLRADATLEATPFRDWQAGKAHCIHLLARYVLGAPGDWKMIPTTANGQPAATVYRRDADGTLRPNGIVVLAATATGVSRVIAFHHDPALVKLFE